jgi:long-chain acyl-CoA synthetase
MDKIWLASYPKGVPAEIGPGPCESLGELFQDVCRRFPDRVAYINMGATLRYRELARLAEAFGSYLQSRGLPRGARVALMMPNCLQYPVCMFGALAAGYVVVNCNPLYTRRELAHQLSDSGAEALVVVENFAHVVEQALPDVRLQHVLVTGLGDLMAWPKGWLTNLVVRRVRKMVPAWRIPQAVALGRALAQGRRRPAAAVPVGRNDLAFLQYTGGTTGVAKGAMLTHGNHARQCRAGATRGSRQRSSAAGPELMVTALAALSHVRADGELLHLHLQLGATNVLITNPRDIPALRGRVGEVPIYGGDRRQYAVQCVGAPPTDFARRRFQRSSQ